MSKYLVLFLSSASAQEQMAKASPEQAKAGMDAWTAWAQTAGPAVVDPGTPLAYVTTVPTDSSARGSTHTGGYSILEAESADALRTLLADHPHFGAPDAAIEVHEMLTMPSA